MGLKVQTSWDDSKFVNYKVVAKKSLNFFDAIKNSNKYYTIEIHEGTNAYRVFTDYGRLGSTSKKEVRMADSLYEAEHEFEKIVREKKKKGYVEIDLVQSSTGSQLAQKLVDTSLLPVDTTKKSTKKEVKSYLPAEVQAFVRQVFEEAERKLNYFVRGTAVGNGGSPLGTLSQLQIQKGRNMLQEISDIIIRRGAGVSVRDVLEASNEYFRYIPKAWGSKVTPEMIAIKSLEEINMQLDILKFYEDSLRMGDIMFDSKHIDKQYESLKTKMSVVAPDSDVFINLAKMIHNSESHHHNVHLNIRNIFAIEQQNAPKFDGRCGNVTPLFHGTRSANLPGILSTNLKLPTQLKGVVITGAMFGPGLYFADQSTKSSQYSCARFGNVQNKHDSAFMFVADVALGKMKEVTNSHYFIEPPRGYDSVKGCKGPSLLHNEFIVYKENQHELKYMIEFVPSRKRGY